MSIKFTVTTQPIRMHKVPGTSGEHSEAKTGSYSLLPCFCHLVEVNVPRHQVIGGAGDSDEGLVLRTVYTTGMVQTACISADQFSSFH
jgi:hypothetical protein